MAWSSAARAESTAGGAVGDGGEVGRCHRDHHAAGGGAGFLGLCDVTRNGCAVDEGEGSGVVARPRSDAVAEFAPPLLRRRRCGRRGCDCIGQRGVGIDTQRRDQGVLIVEVPEEGSGGHPHLAGDASHRQAGAVGRELSPRVRLDLGNGLGAPLCSSGRLGAVGCCSQCSTFARCPWCLGTVIRHRVIIAHMVNGSDGCAPGSSPLPTVRWRLCRMARERPGYRALCGSAGW